MILTTGKGKPPSGRYDDLYPLLLYSVYSKNLKHRNSLDKPELDKAEEVRTAEAAAVGSVLLLGPGHCSEYYNCTAAPCRRRPTKTINKIIKEFQKKI